MKIKIDLKSPLLMLTVVLASCGKSPAPPASHSHAESSDDSLPQMSTSGAYGNAAEQDSLASIATDDGNAISSTSSSAYDDGYLDGEAMAEEDRLAGRPGMQEGLDDDDEGYEEGFDDGYE